MSRPVVQTIEQIEARVVEVREAENEALRVLVHAMREIAVRLPVESRLPAVLAQRAKAIEEGVRLFGDYGSRATATGNEFCALLRDVINEGIAGSGSGSLEPEPGARATTTNSSPRN